jgi:hypothetical protein
MNGHVYADDDGEDKWRRRQFWADIARIALTAADLLDRLFGGPGLRF